MPGGIAKGGKKERKKRETPQSRNERPRNSTNKKKISERANFEPNTT